MISLRRFFAIVTLILVVTPTLGMDGAASSKPVVLMLLMESEDLASLQEAFKNELSLELVTHTLLVKPQYSFSSDTLSARIAVIRQIAAANQAEVVMWLEKINENTVTLQLVVAVPGRSMVRSVEARLGSDTEGELAIAARQMLEEIHISLKEKTVSPSTEGQPPPSSAGPSAPARSPQSPPGDISHSKHRHTYLSVGLDTTGPFKDMSLSPVLLGGTVSVGIGWTRGIYADVTLTVFAAPSPNVTNGTFRTIGVRPGVGIGYFWTHRAFTFGPYLGLQVPWQTAVATLDDKQEKEDNWWNFRLVPSIDLRLSLHRNVLILLRPGVGILVNQEVFERESNKADIYRSPYVEWNIIWGVVIRFN